MTSKPFSVGRLRFIVNKAACFEDEPDHAVFTYGEIMRMIDEVEEWSNQ